MARNPRVALGAPAQRGPHRRRRRGRQISRRQEMSARSFRSVFMVASCAGAALGCYLVSLASHRNAPRSRMSRPRSCSPSATFACCRRRSERAAGWPSSNAGTSRCSLCPRRRPTSSSKAASSSRGWPRREPKLNVEAPVVLASAPAPHPQSAPLEEGEPRADGAGAAASTAAQLMHQASLRIQRASMSAVPAETAQSRRAQACGAGLPSRRRKAAESTSAAPNKPAKAAEAKPAKTATESWG